MQVLCTVLGAVFLNRARIVPVSKKFRRSGLLTLRSFFPAELLLRFEFAHRVGYVLVRHDRIPIEHAARFPVAGYSKERLDGSFAPCTA